MARKSTKSRTIRGGNERNIIISDWGRFFSRKMSHWDRFFLGHFPKRTVPNTKKGEKNESFNYRSIFWNRKRYGKRICRKKIRFSNSCQKRLNELKTELEVKYKINVKTEVKDLSDEENCISLYEENKDIDILVNNAGFGVFGEFTKTDIQKELNLIKTNVIAVHILTKLYLKDMVEKNSGKILNVSSIAGSMPGPLMCAYYSSKAYVLRLSEGIREELNKKKSNVKISVLQPGPVNTNFNNVAGVKFNLSSKSSEYVAKYAVKNFQKGKFNIVPGFMIKCAKFMSKITPDFIVAKICYHMQEKKK